MGASIRITPRYELPRQAVADDLRNDDDTVGVIDQRLLPHEFATLDLRTMEDCAEAIRNMTVRGAPLIGATAAYGICFALKADPGDAGFERAYAVLHKTRPTAINLKWALDQMKTAIAQIPPAKRLDAAWKRAAELCDEDVAVCEAIGREGLQIFRAILAGKPPGSKLNVPDPLQRGLAGLCRLGHGARADFHGA